MFDGRLFRCDGTTSFADLKSKHQFTDDLIYLALDELSEKNLLAENYESNFRGVSRREAIRRLGIVSLIALPVISVLIAPPAAQASSVCGGLGTTGASCTSSSQCCPSNTTAVTTPGTGGNPPTVVVFTGACCRTGSGGGPYGGNNTCVPGSGGFTVPAGTISYNGLTTTGGPVICSP